MKVLLSTGHGRLHLVQSATWLRKAGVAVTMLTGWMPGNPDGWLVRLASAIVRRNLAPGMRKRLVPELEGNVISCSFAEMADQLLRIIGRILRIDMQKISVLGWRIFGRQSRGAIARGGYDIFHVRSGAGHGGAIEKARRMGMRVIVDHSIAHPGYMERELRPEYERRGLPFDLGMSSPFWRMIDEDCRWADKVLVNSEFVRDTFMAEGYPAQKIEVAYLGVRPDFFGLRMKTAVGSKSLKLLFTGGFGFRKGGEYILEALMRINAERPGSFTMDFVGSYDNRLVKEYENDKLPVKFHGHIPQDDLKTFLAESDVYVFPSLAEGCASSGMEAMAAGLCVVATHESGLPITDGENGCVVPKKDANAIAEKILWLMNHPDEIDRIGSKATELIRTEYTWEKYAEKVSRLYEAIA